jgi:hypothetical protein
MQLQTFDSTESKIFLDKLNNNNFARRTMHCKIVGYLAYTFQTTKVYESNRDRISLLPGILMNPCRDGVLWGPKGYKMAFSISL